MRVTQIQEQRTAWQGALTHRSITNLSNQYTNARFIHYVLDALSPVHFISICGLLFNQLCLRLILCFIPIDIIRIFIECGSNLHCMLRIPLCQSLECHNPLESAQPRPLAAYMTPAVHISHCYSPPGALALSSAFTSSFSSSSFIFFVVHFVHRTLSIGEVGMWHTQNVQLPQLLEILMN